MGQPVTSAEQLQRLADAVEALLLSASDAEVLALQSEKESRRTSAEVFKLVRQQLEAFGLASSVSKAEASWPARHTGPTLVDFLRQLAASHGGVSPQLQASLRASGDKKRDDLDALAMELLAKPASAKARRRPKK